MDKLLENVENKRLSVNELQNNVNKTKDSQHQKHLQLIQEADIIFTQISKETIEETESTETVETISNKINELEKRYNILTYELSSLRPNSFIFSQIPAKNGKPPLTCYTDGTFEENTTQTFF